MAVFWRAFILKLSISPVEVMDWQIWECVNDMGIWDQIIVLGTGGVQVKVSDFSD